jgi:hypothetical protein
VGTHAKSNHIPGYSGFIPIAQHNELAVTKGSLEKDRGDAKKDMLLCAMDQYPRNRLPGYQGYRNKVRGVWRFGVGLRAALRVVR